VLENHSYEEIVGNRRASYLDSLARRGLLLTNYFAVAHPSLPNYLALVGGSTFGISSDCTRCSVSGPSLADQLEATHHTWKGYMESMPTPCFGGALAGRYAKKHNPFAYFTDLTGDRARCRVHVQPLSAMEADLRSGGLPDFSLVIPNLCHDMHDCSVAQGDAWLRSFLPPVIRQVASGVVVVTFDEDDGSSGNHVPTLVVGPGVESGGRSAVRYDHYSLLRTIEALFGLPPLRRAAGARPIDLGPTG
jgi:hypothetical protein